MQLVHVYLNWFWRNSLLKCVSQPKIAKKSIKPLILIVTYALSRTITEIQRLIGQKSQFFSTLLSFSPLVRGDPLQIYAKALWFLKLESSRQLTVRIW